MNRLPDHETRLNECREMAEEVRAAGHTPALEIEPKENQPSPGVTSENPRRGLFAPIHMAPAHDGVPHEYILHIHTQLCSNCGCGEMHSEFFAYFRLRSRMGGNVVTHLRRAERPMYNLPVRRIPLTPTKVPFCSECETIDLSHLPSPPQESNLTNLPEPALKGQKPKSPATPKPTTKATLEDLI